MHIHIEKVIIIPILQSSSQNRVCVFSKVKPQQELTTPHPDPLEEFHFSLQFPSKMSLASFHPDATGHFFWLTSQTLS
jgi:hypothetical protein